MVMTDRPISTCSRARSYETIYDIYLQKKAQKINIHSDIIVSFYFHILRKSSPFEFHLVSPFVVSTFALFFIPGSFYCFRPM